MSDFNPFYYQQKLIDDAKISNEEAQSLIDKAIKDGHQVTHFGHLYGPYCNYVSYWISNGTMVQMTEPASLHWVDLTILRGFE
jgi:hypothetical protein